MPDEEEPIEPELEIEPDIKQTEHIGQQPPPPNG